MICSESIEARESGEESGGRVVRFEGADERLTHSLKRTLRPTEPALPKVAVGVRAAACASLAGRA